MTKHQSVHLRINLKRDVLIHKLKHRTVYSVRSGAGGSRTFFHSPEYYSVCHAYPKKLTNNINDVSCSRCLDYIRKYITRHKEPKQRLPFRKFKSASD